MLTLLLLCSCGKKEFECDVHSELCPGLDIQIQNSSSLIKKYAPEKLEFTVGWKLPDKPEDPASLKAAIISTTDIPCRMALTTEPKPPAMVLSLPMPTSQLGDSLAYSVSLDPMLLTSLRLGRASLCIWGRDIGSAEVFVINKSIQIGPAFANFTEDFSNSVKLQNPYLPVSIGLADSKQMFMSFEGTQIVGMTPYRVRDIRAYSYSSNTILLDAKYQVAPMGFTAVSPTLAMPNLSKIVLLLPDTKKYNMFLCDQTTATAVSCPTDGSSGQRWNVPGGALALATDRKSDSLIVATDGTVSDGTQNTIRWYDIKNLQPSQELSARLQWSAGKPSNSPGERTILAVGDLASLDMSGNPDGLPDVVAVQSVTLDVNILIQPSSPVPNLVANSQYSAGLKQTLQQALGSGAIKALATGDLDGDQLADIVLGFKGADQISYLCVLFNQGNGTFRLSGTPSFLGTAEASLKIPTMAPIVDIALGDVDGVMGNELVVLTAPSANKATISVYKIM